MLHTYDDVVIVTTMSGRCIDVSQSFATLLGVEQKRGAGWAKAKPRPKQPHRKRR